MISKKDRFEVITKKGSKLPQSMCNAHCAGGGPPDNPDPRDEELSSRTGDFQDQPRNVGSTATKEAHKQGILTTFRKVEVSQSEEKVCNSKGTQVQIFTS